ESAIAVAKSDWQVDHRIGPEAPREGANTGTGATRNMSLKANVTVHVREVDRATVLASRPAHAVAVRGHPIIGQKNGCLVIHVLVVGKPIQRGKGSRVGARFDGGIVSVFPDMHVEHAFAHTSEDVTDVRNAPSRRGPHRGPQHEAIRTPKTCGDFERKSAVLTRSGRNPNGSAQPHHAVDHPNCGSGTSWV